MSRLLHVLLVEDSQDDADLLLLELRRGGYEPRSDRVDTMQTMRASLDRQGWDIVICDHAMPGFSSMAALALVKGRNLDVPFIIVSGQIGEDEAVAAMKAGAHDYLMKDRLARLVPAVARELRETEVRRARRQSEEALRESEARNRAVLEAVLDGILTVAEAGIIESLNPAAERLFGYSTEEIVGQSIDRLITAPSDTPFEQHFLNCFRDREWKEEGIAQEVTGRRKDGSAFPLELKVSQLHWGRTPVFTCLVHDFTERKQAEERLRRSERELADFFENATIGFHWAGPDGIILRANRAELELLGYMREEYLGHHLAEFHADQELAQDLLARLNRGETVHNYDTRLRCKDGSIKHVRLSANVLWEDGQFIHTRCFTRDITERKLAEEALQRANATMASILETLPDIVFVIGSQREIRFSNPAAVRFADELSLKNGLPPEIDPLIEQVMASGVHHLPADFRNVHRFRIQNEDKFYLPRIVAIRSLEAANFGVAVLLQDVTAFRLLDEVKTNLIATVSHELRTPLTSLRMALLLLLEETIGPLNNGQKEMLTIARDAAERLLRTLNALLDLARFEEGLSELQSESIAPGHLINAAVGEIKHALVSKALTLKEEIEDELPSLRVDSVRIVHVLTNLLTNAIKYSPTGREIIVRCRRTEGDKVRFSVVDQGPGIPLEYQSRIFDRFFRLPSHGKGGAGLGLAIAKEFVEAHKGHIGVVSQPNAGSEFYFDLNASAE